MEPKNRSMTKQHVKYVSWQEIMKLVSVIIGRIVKTYSDDYHKFHNTLPEESPRKQAFKVYGVPRGGAALAPLFGIPVDSPMDADIIVDDLIESGRTKIHYEQEFKKPFYALIEKGVTPGYPKEDWLQFPWETSPDVDMEENIVRLFQFIGEDYTREGLKDTPRRYLKMIKELTSYPPFKLTTFDNPGKQEIITVKDIPFYSLCEHHLTPFFGTGSISYKPTDKIVGISKLPRLLDKYSRRLQNQERIGVLVATELQEALQCEWVEVKLLARHLCM
jgi:GTP cyclohydrolase I